MPLEPLRHLQREASLLTAPLHRRRYFTTLGVAAVNLTPSVPLSNVACSFLFGFFNLLAGLFWPLPSLLLLPHHLPPRPTTLPPLQVPLQVS